MWLVENLKLNMWFPYVPLIVVLPNCAKMEDEMEAPLTLGIPVPRKNIRNNLSILKDLL